MSKINIPDGAKAVIHLLEGDCFEAYVVGGCVRDSLLGLEPHDWDICTSATPSEVLELCSKRGIRTIETGMEHGTITVCLDGIGEQYEVTTFRIDGDYSDHRRPDSVTFTSGLDEDLSRRDFTINAMAYNDAVGLIDPFGGRDSLVRREISCVGNPAHRFEEDALRIMRALRFASTYGFRIEDGTAKAVHLFAPSLCDIAVERIQSELCKLLLGDGALGILLDYSDVIATIIPEIEPCIGFNQNNRYHEYTVYDHIAHAVANYKGKDISVKVALLLHDIGKPLCYTEDSNGGHFHGHSVPSHDLAEQVIRRLRFDNNTASEILELVLYHDSVIEPTPKTVRRWLSKIGLTRFMQLLDVRMADILAHTKGTQASRIDRCNVLRSITEDVIREKQCFTLKDLSTNGFDLMVMLDLEEGKQIGEILNYLLNEVINGNIQNENHELLEEAEKYIKERSK